MNAARGETCLVIDGAPRRLCLTLGALAEIEASLGCKRISELNARIRAVSAADLLLVLAALLRGGGEADIAARLAEARVAPTAAAEAVGEAFRLGMDG